MTNWDVIVVGGGISGLSVGALLAENRKSVLILEKERYIGGRAFSTRYRGHIVDNGIHGIALTGYMEEVFSRLGKPFPEFAHHPTSEVLHEGRWQDMAMLYPHKEFRRIIREDVESQPYAELEKQDNVSIKEWVSKRTNDQSVHFQFFYLAWNLLGGNRYEDVAASTLLLFIKRRLEVAGTLRGCMANPSQGISAFVNPLAEAVRERGGEIRTDAKVDSLLIEDGRARGVWIETGDRLFSSQLVDVELVEAPVVVSTLPVWDLFTIVSEDEFPRWYVDSVECVKRKTAPVFTLICGMDAMLWDDRGTSRWVPRLPKVGLGGLFLHVPYGDPAGEHQFVAVLQSHWTDVPSLFEAGQAKNRIALERIWSLFEEETKELFPDFERHCLWKIRHTAHWALAEAPGAAGRHRPSIKPPEVKNLYLVSDTVREGISIGFDSCACAALHLVDRIL